MIEIRFKDTDPDTGEVSQDKRICICENEISANWILHALNLAQAEETDPNREIYSNLLTFEDDEDISDWDTTLMDGLDDI
jgi:hypothetical protein